MTPAIGGSLAQKAVLAREAANRTCRHNEASHAIYVSQPGPVAALIDRAAKGGA
jgi:hypothetical protein